MPIGPARMPLFDHLGELRMRLVRIVVCLIIGVCVFYFATPTMGQFLMIPISEYLPKGPDGLPSFMAIDPFEAFSTRFKISICRRSSPTSASGSSPRSQQPWRCSS